MNNQEIKSFFIMRLNNFDIFQEIESFEINIWLLNFKTSKLFFGEQMSKKQYLDFWFPDQTCVYSIFDEIESF